MHEAELRRELEQLAARLQRVERLLQIAPEGMSTKTPGADAPQPAAETVHVAADLALIERLSADQRMNQGIKAPPTAAIAPPVASSSPKAPPVAPPLASSGKPGAFQSLKHGWQQ